MKKSLGAFQVEGVYTDSSRKLDSKPNGVKPILQSNFEVEGVCNKIMKFQKLEVFEKHFKEAFPKHLSSIYVVISPHDSERKKILTSLVYLLEPQSDLKKCLSLGEAISHLKGGSLLSLQVVASLNQSELFTDAEMALFLSYIQNPIPQNCLLIAAGHSKQIMDLYVKGKKEMVFLDLSLEKPWEEKDRIQKWAVQTIASRKKRIDANALRLLFERLPLDRLLLEQEIEKLVCFVGDKEMINAGDVELISSQFSEVNPFEFARNIAFRKLEKIPFINDISLSLSIVSQLRAQFEIGLKILALLMKGKSTEEISKQFPRLWPKAFQECLDGAVKKGESFYKKGLIALFDLEWGLKTSLAKPEVLISIFCAKSSFFH